MIKIKYLARFLQFYNDFFPSFSLRGATRRNILQNWNGYCLSYISFTL